MGEETWVRKNANSPKGKSNSQKVRQANGASSTPPLSTPPPGRGILRGGLATSPVYGESPMKLPPPEPSPDELLELLNSQIKSWEHRVESKISGVMTQAGAVSAKLNECCADLQNHVQGNHAALQSNAPGAPYALRPGVAKVSGMQEPATKWQAASSPPK